MVSENQIVTHSSYNDYYGIEFNYVFGGTSIKSNRIYAQNSGYGIYTQNSDGSQGDSVVVANNFISLGGTDVAYGLYISMI